MPAPSKLVKRLDELGDALEGLVQRAFDAANARTAALEKRVADLEYRPTRYRGAWRAKAPYRPGDIVLHEGALWSCSGLTVPSDEAPGGGGKWELVLPGIANDHKAD